MSFTDWLKSKKALIKENQRLHNLTVQATIILQSLHNTLAYTMSESENNLLDSQAILGAIALQHNGEIVVKDDMIKMMKSPEYKLRLIIERNKENDGTCIRTIEDKSTESITNE
jgi:hypothetical protein